MSERKLETPMVFTFLPDGRPPGYARPLGSLQSSAFRHGDGPAGMGGKILDAAFGEDGVCHLLQKLRIEGGHGDGVGEDGGGSGTGHVVGDFVPPVKFADV